MNVVAIVKEKVVTYRKRGTKNTMKQQFITLVGVITHFYSLAAQNLTVWIMNMLSL